ERRAEPRGDVPVDPADVVPRAVRLVLVEVEPRAAQRALVRADALIADLLLGEDLDVPELLHHVLRDHGIGTAGSRSFSSASASTPSACARTVRAMRWRVASQKISFTSPGRTHVRPLRNAFTRLSASRCWYERGEMPSSSISFRSSRPALDGSLVA